MNFRSLIPALFIVALSLPAGAASLVCPDLALATQVNACPSEDELKHTYSGFCSDNAKAYANQTDTCPRYEDYRKMKNTALWESKDGNFDAYVSCGLPQAKVKALKATGMALEQQRKLTKLVCSYPNNIRFTYRTKAACVIDNAEACAKDAASCRATCN